MLQAVLHNTKRDVGLPFHVAGSVVVPNLLTVQKTVLTNILRRALRDSDVTATSKLKSAKR